MLEKIKKNFYFGEEVKGYDEKVLNEREIRAGAGILFLAAISTFFLGCQGGDLFLINIFGIYFLIEFVIRVLINPKFAPSLILGRFFVRNQKPEYTGAPQKRFAWSIGLILAIIFFVSAVILSTVSILNLILCIICLSFLFFESVFGICGGCVIYQKILKKKAKYCPGGTCEVHLREKIQEISKFQVLILIFVFVSIFLAFNYGDNFSKIKLEKKSQKGCVLNI